MSDYRSRRSDNPKGLSFFYADFYASYIRAIIKEVVWVLVFLRDINWGQEERGRYEV